MPAMVAASAVGLHGAVAVRDRGAATLFPGRVAPDALVDMSLAGEDGLSPCRQHQFRGQPGQCRHRQHLRPRHLRQSQARRRHLSDGPRHVRARPLADRRKTGRTARHRSGHHVRAGPKESLRARRRQHGARNAHVAVGSLQDDGLRVITRRPETWTIGSSSAVLQQVRPK